MLERAVPILPGDDLAVAKEFYVGKLGFHEYFGSSICVHEFSHGIMRGAIDTVDPEYRKAVEAAYAAAKKPGLSSAQGYPGNNFNEYWATGIEAYVFGSGRGPETLLETDSRLYELVRQVIPSTKMPGNVYVGRGR
jgi:hypothetical protein